MEREGATGIYVGLVQRVPLGVEVSAYLTEAMALVQGTRPGVVFLLEDAIGGRNPNSAAALGAAAAAVLGPTWGALPMSLAAVGGGNGWRCVLYDTNYAAPVGYTLERCGQGSAGQPSFSLAHVHLALTSGAGSLKALLMRASRDTPEAAAVAYWEACVRHLEGGSVLCGSTGARSAEQTRQWRELVSDDGHMRDIFTGNIDAAAVVDVGLYAAPTHRVICEEGEVDGATAASVGIGYGQFFVETARERAANDWGGDDDDSLFAPRSVNAPDSYFDAEEAGGAEPSARRARVLG